MRGVGPFDLDVAALDIDSDVEPDASRQNNPDHLHQALRLDADELLARQGPAREGAYQRSDEPEEQAGAVAVRARAPERRRRPVRRERLIAVRVCGSLGLGPATEHVSPPTRCVFGSSAALVRLRRTVGPM